MASAVDSTLDVVFWFLDRALDENEYLQPQKLQRLLYLSQSYYGALNRGAKLMPAVFVADEMGPVEPTIFRMLANGKPYNVESRPVPEGVGHFLDSMWRKFGAHSTEHLSRLVGGHPPYVAALKKGPRTEIGYATMIKFYGSREGTEKGAPAPAEVLRPRVMRSQDGRPVSVTRWSIPTKK
ncbi:MAG: hypothetical protein HQL39_11705 [Alphaproteobacteria bacterium]|nr:hypothetical protein [Alphaproteobacteria bacterium]